MTWPDLIAWLYQELPPGSGVLLLILLLVAVICFLAYLRVRVFEAKAYNGLLSKPPPPVLGREPSAPRHRTHLTGPRSSDLLQHRRR